LVIAATKEKVTDYNSSVSPSNLTGQSSISGSVTKILTYTVQVSNENLTLSLLRAC